VEDANITNKPSKLKDKKVLSAIIVFIVLLLVIGGIFVFTRGGDDTDNDSSNPIIGDSSNLPSLDPDEIGMVVTVRKDGKALMFELTKADDIELVEYTIEYEKDIDGERVPEGIFGLMNIGEDGRTDTDFREFGTCSSGKCRYDEVVSDVTIILKITKVNGDEFQVKKVVKLEV